MSENNNLPQKKDDTGLALQKTNRLLSITNKILANSAVANNIDVINSEINWTLLLEHKGFFNQLFSTYYKFNEIELIKFNRKLSIGSPYLILDSGAIHLKTIFGLIYNKNIFWTDYLKNIYYEEPVLLYAGAGSDEYSYEINFDLLPLEYDGYDYAEIEMNCENMEDFYNDSISKYFNYNELIDIVKNNNNEYICNKHIYSQLLKILHSNIPNFSIDKFYDKF